MNRLPLVATLLVLGTLAWAEPRFRADDGNFWHLDDNPALAAVSGDALALGVGASPNPGWTRPATTVKVISPLLSFQYQWKGPTDSVLGLGTALGPWEGLSFGYRTDEVTTRSVRQVDHSFGALYRPFDLVSTAVTVDDAFGPGRVWGGGLALRPLTLWAPDAGWLTLSADGTLGTKPALERIGGRLSWHGSDLRVWYEPGSRVPGFEVTVGLGPSETTLSPRQAGQAIRWSTRTPGPGAWGAQILRIRDAGTLASTPVAPTLFSSGRTRDLPGLVALLDRAAADPSVRAVAFEDPPMAGGLAGAEDLRLALGRLAQAGKKVYIHADDYGDSLGFQGWIASADRLSLHPTGSVWLTASGSRRLYLKGLFDKIGVRFVNLAPWETKSANNTLAFSSMPEGEKAMLKRFLSDRADQALGTLASGRGPRLKGDPAALVAQGPWMVGTEALGAGLIDALETRAGFEEFLAKEYPGAALVDDLDPPRETRWGPAVSRRTVALVHLAGDIVPGVGEAGRSIGRAAAEVVQALRNDAGIRAIVLRVDSPGGAVSPSDTLADEVRKTVEAGKPVVVVMGNVAASGGYYLSAPATRIFARPGTLTGSIGVTAALFTGEKALGMLGIQADGVDLAPSSSFGDWTRDVPDADAKKWNAMILATYDRFLDVVAAGRHLDKSVVEPLARGQVYTGREALTLGLVDALGGQEDAKVWLESTLGGPVEFRDVVPGETNPWGGLLGPLALSMVEASGSPTLKLAASLDPVTAPWADELAGAAARGPGPWVWADLR